MKEIIDIDNLGEAGHPKLSEDITSGDVTRDDNIKCPTSQTDAWKEFEDNLKAGTDKGAKRVNCTVDSAIAYTLDECRIGGHSRSDMINAILRTFISRHTEELKCHRKVKQTLL